MIRPIALVLLLLPGLVLGQEPEEPDIEHVEAGVCKDLPAGWFLNESAMASTDAFLSKVQDELTKAKADSANKDAQIASLQASVQTIAAKPGLSPIAVGALLLVGALVGGAVVVYTTRH